jgi:translation initiation factor 3 subunit D
MFSVENPFVDEEEVNEEEKGFPVASVGYRYRKWDLGNDVILLARCETTPSFR